MSTRSLPAPLALRPTSTTFTRLGAALAACAQRAEQRPGLAEPNAEVLRDLRIALELAPSEVDRQVRK